MVKILVLILLFPILMLGCSVSLIRYGWAIITNSECAWMIAVAIDDLTNVACNGTLGQTISFRAATAMQSGRRWGCILCRVLDFIQKNHCQDALKNPINNIDNDYGSRT